MPARVELRHVSAGRLRLRVAGGNGSRGSLSQVAKGLETHPRVSRVSFNPATRTILVLHQGEAKELIAYGELQKLFTLEEALEPPSKPRGPRPSHRLIQSISAGLESFDGGVMASSRGRIDLPTMAFATLVGAALWRARGGALVPSAVSLVSIAFGVIGMKRT